MSQPIENLFQRVVGARSLSPAQSRTAKLMQEGIAKMAKKVGEEAVEVSLCAVAGEHEALVRESADLLYNLVVLWAGAGVSPDEIWAEMARREELLGIAEKVPKSIARRALAGGPRGPSVRSAESAVAAAAMPQKA
ncbi:MAG TPA: phosphoribosyl-ATP diphosphatase [Hyphomicrobiales bacterium]|nr:phosphoribosyl-ATP diphosphatase [Hyphomicrobiales bacterium]